MTLGISVSRLLQRIYYQNLEIHKISLPVVAECTVGCIVADMAEGSCPAE